MLPEEGHEQIRREFLNGTLILSLRGQFLGGEETDSIRAYLRDDSAVASTVVLDMEDVSFVNSSFLSSLLAAHTASTRRGGAVLLCSLGPTVKNIFSLTRLDSVIPVYGSKEEALSSIRSNR